MDKQTSRTSTKLAVVATIVSALLTGGCSQKSVDEYVAEARQMTEQGDANAAVIAYKNAIQKNPQAALPRFELGKLYLSQNKYESAEKELSKARELGHPASDVVPLLALAYQQTGAENALADVDHNTQGMTAVQRAEVGFYKVQALLELDKKDEALALIDELMALDTQSVYVGLLEVFSDVLNEDLDSAIAKAEALREQAPLNKDVLQQSARLYMTNRDVDSAIAVYTDYVTAYPADVQTKFALISLLVETRQLSEAKPYVDSLLELNNDHPLLNQYRGIIAAGEGDHKAALARIEKAIQNGSDDPAARLIAGFSAYQLQDYGAARKHLSMIASRLPDNHPGLRMLADSLLQEGKSNDAFSVLSRIEGGLQSDADLFSRAGAQLLREGNLVDAQAMVEKTEPLSESAEQLARLGMLKLSLNDIDGIVNLEQAAEKAPDSVITQSTLVQAYLASGDIDKAKEVAQQWRQTQPELIEPVLTLANIAINGERFDEADTLLSEAAQLDADSDAVKYGRIRLASAKGEQDKALDMLKTHLSKTPDDITALAMWYPLAKENQRAAQVLEHARKAVNNSPDNLPLRLLAARLFVAEQKLDNAAELLVPVKPDNETPVAYWTVRGQALMGSKDIDSATAHYKQWLSLYPQNVDAVKGMLVIMDAKGQYEDGLTLVNNTLEKRPDAQLLLLKTYFLSRLGKTRDAREILAPFPDNVKALPFVQGVEARLLLQENKPAEAIPHAMAAYEARQNTQNAILVLAAQEFAGQAQQGFEFLSEHVAANPDDIRSAMLLAERTIGRDRNQAVSLYEEILNDAPESFVVLNNLAYLYAESGNIERAATLARQAVDIQPTNADAVDTLAQIRIKQGREDDAMTLYETIANQDIANEEVYLNYVELLLKQGKTTLAKRRLRERTFELPVSQERRQQLEKEYQL